MGCGSGTRCAGGGGCGSGGVSGSGVPGGAGGSGPANRDGTLRDVVGVKFNNTAKTYYYDSSGLNLTVETPLIVEGEHGGEEYARVVQATSASSRFAGARLKKILRLASMQDTACNEENLRRQKEAFEFAQARIKHRHMDMKLVYAEESFDRRKLTFYFTAEERVDFRDLVKELAQQFRSRIEMRQIGPRDEAKVLGGFGVCGRPLCCTTFLREFAPVSIRMAKRQGLSLNPAKISGRCGRLMCCLKYEDTGEDLRRKAPGGGRRQPQEEPPPA